MITAQQAMEFKMLASQINPHFLYNALESIRMKAFTVGDREVATAIKLLGKSMRYVLENIGTSFTTLGKELEHVETYLAIQKLRFGEKFNKLTCPRFIFYLYCYSRLWKMQYCMVWKKRNQVA